MIYTNKKVSQSRNPAQQTAKIIANVDALVSKDFIRLSADTVYLDPVLWKDKATASNWINCLQIYYVIKKGLKKTQPIYFKHIHTDELIGTLISKTVKVLLFVEES